MSWGLNSPGPVALSLRSARCGSPGSGALPGHLGTQSVAGETQHKTKHTGVGKRQRDVETMGWVWGKIAHVIPAQPPMIVQLGEGSVSRLRCGY